MAGPRGDVVGVADGGGGHQIVDSECPCAGSVGSDHPGVPSRFGRPIGALDVRGVQLDVTGRDLLVLFT